MNRIYDFIDLNINLIPNKKIIVVGNFAMVLNKHIIKETDVDFFFDTDVISFKSTDSKICRLFNTRTIFSTDYLDRATRIEVYHNIEIFAVSVEDVIINKISGYDRIKHFDDIKNYLKLTNLTKVKLVLENAEKRNYGVYEEKFRSLISKFKKDYKIL